MYKFNIPDEKKIRVIIDTAAFRAVFKTAGLYSPPSIRSLKAFLLLKKEFYNHYIGYE